ncbi:MAG: DUF1501 domain-containing protein [Rhodospirillales bacterium]|nr:DUF1501 domain-containing protein [Rhodospirillales bacterium]
MRFSFGSGRKNCDGVTRRQALRIGSTGLIGGLSLPMLLELQAKAATQAPAKAQACIFLFLEGGPSHIDMWDLKPDAPEEIRGPFKPIRTNVTGTMICEHLPMCARIANKYTIVRSHSHNDNGHATGYHYVMTGYKADFLDGNTRQPNNHMFPSVGSIISRELGAKSTLPPYINMPHIMAGGGPGFYGSAHAPFVIESNPSQADFEVQDLRPLEGLSASRQARRGRLLAELETLEGDRASQGSAQSMSTYYQRARDMMTSAEARRAFNIREEPQSVRDAYGPSSLGQCALLARRLVQSGCRFVGVDHSGWDHHFTIFPSLEKDMLPHVDRAFSALIKDLDQLGLLDSTLVVLMGEMGRTPRVNKDAGRDHWSQAQSIIFAGGGIKPGQIIGATDRHASMPTTEPIGVQDVLRTLLNQMGVDANKVYYSPQGRPVPIVDGGKIIQGLV